MEKSRFVRYRSCKRDELTHIEDTFSQLGRLERIAKQASRDAIVRAKSKAFSVTYLENGWIIREDVDGRKVKVKELKQSFKKKRPAGARYQLS